MIFFARLQVKKWRNLEMPVSKVKKSTRTNKLFERYSNGALSFSLETDDTEYYLKSIISKIPDSELQTPEIKALYAERIKLARQGIQPPGKRLTQDEVGHAFGVSSVAIHKKEQGTAPIDREDLLSFCLLYQVTPDYLLGKVSDPHSFIRKSPVILTKLHRIKKVVKRLRKKYKARKKATKQSATPTKEEQEEESLRAEHSPTIAMSFSLPAAAVRSRAQLIIYKTYSDSELYAAFLKLASATFDTQEKFLSRLQGLPDIDSCPLAEELRSVLTEPFQMEWTYFIEFKCENERSQICQYMDQLARLGTCNFACLDFMARISILSKETQNMVKTLLNMSFIE